MPASIIVYAPGDRAMQYAEHLRERFGLRRVFDARDGATFLGNPPQVGRLIVTSTEEGADNIAASCGNRLRVMTLDEALDEVGRPDPDPAQLSLTSTGANAFDAGGLMYEPTISALPAVGAQPVPASAPGILRAAAQHLQDRAALRDQPAGERSMARTVSAFNALTGHAISERDGWLFMVALKAARACTTPSGIADDYQDGAAYFALAGESVGHTA
jgi:hypothetical protein